MAATKLAGLSKIDYTIVTHYHDDHAGGVPQLLALMPVGTFNDHGDLYEHCPACVSGLNAYTEAIRSGRAKRMTVSAARTLQLRDLAAEMLSSNGEVIPKPVVGAGETDSFCDKSEIRPPDTTENSHSVGVFFVLDASAPQIWAI